MKTSMRLTWRHAAALAVLVASCASFPGCARGLYHRDGARGFIAFVLVDPGDRKGPRDYFARLQAQREGGRTFGIAPFVIHPGPFSFQGVGGVSDPALIGPSTDGIACFELFERSFFTDPAHTVDLCGRYSSGGYQAFNSENDEFRFYPAAYVLEFRVEYDGTDLSYLTRPVGAPAWDLVTTIPFAWDDWLIPSVGAFNLHKKGVYDITAFDWTTTPPVDPTAEELAGWHIQEAYRFDFTAWRKLEGATPDFTGATADLGLARDQLALALAQLPDYVDAKIGKQTARYVIRADKRLEKAQREAFDEDEEGALGQLLRSVRDQGFAAQRTYQLDFRSDF
jgi:hypothetical protein